MPDSYLVLKQGWPEAQFIPGGSANRFVDSKLRRAVGIARIVAPKRTGNLALHTKKTGTLNRGRLRAVGSLYNDAPYASFVTKGTTGPIGPTGPNPMPIPRAGVRLPYRVTGNAQAYFPVGPGHRKKFVSGQRSNDFLKVAMRLAFGNIGV